MTRAAVFSPYEPAAYLVDPDKIETFGLLGPAIQFLTPSEDAGIAPCVMRGTVPPGSCVPLHSHADPETFIIVSGELEALTKPAEGYRWTGLKAGDILHVPGGAKHAWRNTSPKPAVAIVVTTPKLGRFLLEISEAMIPGRPPSAPSAERIRYFNETAERYGYWNATAEENAEVGLSVPTAA
jgi:mannose-6-phosphate isomerase-like protein (cupin superfamily)